MFMLMASFICPLFADTACISEKWAVLNFKVQQNASDSLKNSCAWIKQKDYFEMSILMGNKSNAYKMNRNQLSLPDHLLIVTYDSALRKKVVSEKVDDVTFQGINEEEQTDFVTIRILGNCTAHGMFRMNDEAYELSRFSLTRIDKNVEVLVKTILGNPSPVPLGSKPKQLQDLEITSKKHKERSRRSAEIMQKPKYIELFLIHDHSLYTDLGHDIQKNIDASKDLVTVVDTIFSVFNTRVILVGVEIWNEKDMITVSTDATKVLTDVLNHSNTLLGSPNIDNVQFLTSTRFANGTLGLAYVTGMCHQRYSGSVNVYKMHSHYSKTARTMAHELGHNVGMRHDDGRSCKCPSKNGECIMAAYERDPIPNSFTDCSAQEYEAYLHDYGGCLWDTPSENLNKKNFCGDNVLDEGEECDCGSEYFCTNSCCDASTCKLKKDAECYTGACCQECHFKPEFTSCRAKSNECDLEEYCSGSSGACPIDVHNVNGLTCDSVRTHPGVCLDGTCRSLYTQCQTLWGPETKVADDVCFDHLNPYGESYGHCGHNVTSNTYSACDEEDARCGLLQCKDVQVSYPVIGHNQGATVIKITSGADVSYCYSGTADMGDMSDPGK